MANRNENVAGLLLALALIGALGERIEVERLLPLLVILAFTDFFRITA